MLPAAQQYTLLKHSLLHTFKDYKKAFFVWALALLPLIVPSVVTIISDIFDYSINTAPSIVYILSIGAITSLCKFCFFNLALNWHRTQQFSFKTYIKTLIIIPKLLVAMLIEGISIRIIPFNQLFLGYFPVLIVDHNSVWQSLKKSFNLSGQAPLLALSFFIMEAIQLINFFVLPRFLSFELTVTGYILVNSVYILWCFVFQSFFLLFKVNTYETMHTTFNDTSTQSQGL